MTDPDFTAVEQHRERGHGVHPLAPADRIEISPDVERRRIDPPWLVRFSSDDKLRHGEFVVRALTRGEAEWVARGKLADDERFDSIERLLPAVPA